MIKTAIQQRTVGSLLKEKRKERKLTIDQIAESTKIRREYLSALEEAEYSVFPSEVYLKGFLKNYAKYLGVSSEQALALYRRENVVKIKPKTNDLLNKIREKTKKLVITPNRIILVVIVVLILALIIYLSSYVGKILKKPTLKLSTPIVVDQEGEYTLESDKNTIEIQGEVDISSKITINGQEIGPSTQTTFNKTFDLTSNSNKFVIKVTSPFGRESQTTLTVNKTTASQGDSQNPAVTEIRAAVEILNDNTALTVFVDGAMKIDKSYNKNAKLDFVATDQISITSNKVGSFSVTVNGIQEKIEGKSAIFELIDGKILKK
jgi:cytoskeletal protein RodZ